MARNDARFACGRRDHEPAQLDDVPRERIPFAPRFARLLGEHAAHHLGNRAEHERDAVGQYVVAQHVPAREPAHDRGAEGVDDPPNPRLADAERAHRARLDVGVERALGEPGAAEEPARLCDGDDFRVARDVALALGAIRRFAQDFRAARDHAAERTFARCRPRARQLDATRHHAAIHALARGKIPHVHREAPIPPLRRASLRGAARIAHSWTIPGQCRLDRDWGETRAALEQGLGLSPLLLGPTLGRLAEDSMRRRTGLAMLALCGALAAFAAYPWDRPAVVSAAAAQRAPQWADAVDVDVELVLAVDVSYSMDPDEQALQREGYVSALTSPEFLTALKAGIHARIALTYFEWANSNDQKILLPWRLIDGLASAQTVAAEIARAPYRRAYRTSISGALLFGKRLFDSSGHRGIRRVIDGSGDGTNNEGTLLLPPRAAE